MRVAGRIMVLVAGREAVVVTAHAAECHLLSRSVRLTTPIIFATYRSALPAIYHIPMRNLESDIVEKRWA